MRTIKFKPYYWDYEEDDFNKETIIYIRGLNENNENVLCKVLDFKPFIYLELPKNERWNDFKCKQVFEYLKYRLGENAPLNYKLYKKYKLEYKELVECIYLSFNLHSTTQQVAKMFANNTIYINNKKYSPHSFEVHESNIDPLIKFSTLKKINLSMWIECKEYIYKDELEESIETRKFSKNDIDFYSKWTDIDKCEEPDNFIAKPKFISYDGEMYSENHNSRIPDPLVPNNVIFHISSCIGRDNESIDTYKYYLHTLFNPLDIKEINVDENTKSNDITIIRCKDEKELILKWIDFVKEENPIFMAGFNILKFDMNYIIVRSKELGIIDKVLMKMGNIYSKPAKIKTYNWSSSAYGKQVLTYIDNFSVQLDVLIEVQKNFKLPTYSLNAVSAKFLNNKKEDVSPSELFMLYKFSKDTHNGIFNNLEEFKKYIKKVFVKRKVKGPTREYRKELLNIKDIKDIYQASRKAFYITGLYAIIDVVLPIRLINKLKMIVGMEEMSNCQHIPTSYLHTRGQQIRVIAQVYRETLFNNYLLPAKYRIKIKEDYEGATVQDANAGFFELIATLDFASLYPSIMICDNICLSTLVKDKILSTDYEEQQSLEKEGGWYIKDENVKDEECNVENYETHINCSHDPNAKTGKNKKKICRKYYYRFLKVIFDENGNRYNEGLLCKLLRELLAERKKVKKEMAKYEAIVKMATGNADKVELENYKKYGYTIIQKGDLSDEEILKYKIMFDVANARQLAIKVSCNSVYGALGAYTGDLFFIAGAATTTGRGRELIQIVIDYLNENNPEVDVVYGDTDSVMVKYNGCDLQTTIKRAEQSEKDISRYLRCKHLSIPYNDLINGKLIDEISINDCKTPEEKIKYYSYINTPITLEFENLYGRYLQLTKKRYICHILNRAGVHIGTTKKGVVLTRRDNCNFLKRAYADISDIIVFNQNTYEDIMYKVYEWIEKLFTRQISDIDFIIYVGVKDPLDYCKKKTLKNAKGEEYASIYLDEYDQDIEDFLGQNDPRLVFKNLPQSKLCEKVIRRGGVVPCNIRFEYLYCENENANTNGDKVEEYSFYRENRREYDMKPDLIHYLENQLAKPIAEIINARYPKKDYYIYEKLDDIFDKGFARLKICGEYDLIVDYVSKFKKREDKIKAIVKCSIYRNICGELLDDPRFKLFTDVAKRLYSKKILDILHRSANIPIRRAITPKQCGNKITKNTEIALLSNIDKYKQGDIGKVISFVEDENTKILEYSIEMFDKNIINIYRTEFGIIKYRDDRWFDDIIKARKTYKKVIEKLKEMFSIYEIVY